jgi:hypothetical protein
LYRVVDFPTRITNNSCTAIDSIFLDYSRLNSSHAFSVINGLSDHDAQYLIVSNMVNHQKNKSGSDKRRVTCEASIITCNQMLSRETWDSVLSSHDVNKSFNLFLSIVLVIFETCFPMKFVRNNAYSNQWITKEIKTSCKVKKYLYLMLRCTNYPGLKEYYTRYCMLLKKFIRKPKALYYEGLILVSSNKSKESWKIIKDESGRELKRKPSHSELRDGNVIIDSQNVPEAFNSFFKCS